MSEKVGALRESLDDPEFPQITCRREANGYPAAVLHGRGIWVQAIVGYVNGWGMSLTEVAEAFELPLAKIKEAMIGCRKMPATTCNC